MIWGLISKSVLIVLLGGFALCVGAQEPQPGFKIEDAYTEIDDGVFNLYAKVDILFTDAVNEALDSGVPLVLEVLVVVGRQRGMVWDENLAKLSWRNVLRYHALSGQYVVTEVATGVRHSFRTRGAALAALGRVNRLPLLDHSLLRLGEQYSARMRASLLVEELPAPLRLWAYVSPSWELDSEWFEWLLQSSND
jgi:hypothetical protein